MVIYKGQLYPSGVSEKVSLRNGSINPIAPFVSVIISPLDDSRGGDSFNLWYAGYSLPFEAGQLTFGNGMIIPESTTPVVEGIPDNIKSTNDIEDVQAYVHLAQPIESTNEIEEPLAGFYKDATVDNIESLNEVDLTEWKPVQIVDAADSPEFQKIDPDTLTLIGDPVSISLSSPFNYAVKWIAGSKGRLFVGYTNYPHDGDDKEGYLEIDPNTLELISQVWTQDGPSLLSQVQLAVTSNDRIFVYRHNTIVEVDPDASFGQVGSSWNPSGTHGSIECIYAYGELLFVVGTTNIGVYKTNGLTIGSFTLLDTITLPTWITSDTIWSMSVAGFRGFAYKLSGGEVTEFNPLTAEQIGDWETSSTSYRGIGGQNLSSDINLAVNSSPEDIESTNEVKEPTVELFGATPVDIESTNNIEEPTLINLLDVESLNEIESPSVYGKLSVDLESSNDIDILVFVNVDNVESSNEIDTSSLGYFINNIQTVNEIEDVPAGLVIETDPFELNLNFQSFNFITEVTVSIVPVLSVNSLESLNFLGLTEPKVTNFNYGKIVFTRKSPQITM
jgi:hypothetical protein